MNLDIIVAKESGNLQKSRFGLNKKLKEFGEKDRGEFREI